MKAVHFVLSLIWYGAALMFAPLAIVGVESPTVFCLLKGLIHEDQTI